MRVRTIFELENIFPVLKSCTDCRHIAWYSPQMDDNNCSGLGGNRCCYSRWRNVSIVQCIAKDGLYAEMHCKRASSMKGIDRGNKLASVSES